jgi:5-methylcytosine-specific restriction endonuclease McrA
MAASSFSGLKFAKPRPRLLDKRAVKATLAKQWWEVRRRVKERDGDRCRVCGKPGFEVHHIEFRSRGGKDDTKNLVLLCKRHHEDVHGHVLEIAGNPNKKNGLTFRQVA